MTVADLQRLHDYGYWANARLTQVISGLTAEQIHSGRGWRPWVDQEHPRSRAERRMGLAQPLRRP
jgi:hypothetical protein